MRCEMGEGFGECAAHDFFVYLGDLAADSHRTLGAKDLDELLQGFHHAVG